MPHIKQYALDRVIEVLERAADDATLKQLSLGPFGEEGRKQTEAVREAMRLYMQTWLETPIRECVSVLKGETPAWRL